MSKHAQPRDILMRRLARIVLSAAFGTVELLASWALGWNLLGAGLAIIAGWNLALVGTGLLTLRDAAPWGASGMPR